MNPPDGSSVIQSWEETDGHRPESQTPAGWYDGYAGGELEGQTGEMDKQESLQNHSNPSVFLA